jgi:hypothetical protein
MLKKKTIIVIAIIAAAVIGFGAWTITPYFTNTTIDEPIPTSFDSFSNNERLIGVSFPSAPY